jgi:acyl-CoA reductase-like NAD-dependent aldehyde dehydrogenase
VAGALARAAADAALPQATFALLQSSGFEVGEALVDEPAIAAVGFTGSFAGGKALYDRAGAREHPIPVFAEMGSVNPIVVTEAALTERSEAIAEGLAASVASFGGQLCTKPGVVFVPAGEAGDAFAADLGARLAAAEPQVLLNERRAFASGPRPTVRRRPTCASTRTCWRSASARSCCC